MADSSSDALASYLFIDPSLLDNSSSDGAFSPIICGWSGTVDNQHNIFGPKDWELLNDGYNTPPASTYSGFGRNVILASSTGFPAPSNTAIASRTHPPQVALRAFSTSQTETAFAQDGSFALLNNFKSEPTLNYPHGSLYKSQSTSSPNHRLMYGAEHRSKHAYTSEYSQLPTVSSTQPPPCLSTPMQRCTSPCLNDLETTSSYSFGAHTITMDDFAHVHAFGTTKEKGINMELRFSREKLPSRSGTTISVPLEEWYNTHRHSPYPSLEEKINLALESGKSVQQVCNWLSNKRSRDREVSDQPMDTTRCRSKEFHNESPGLFGPPQLGFIPINRASANGYTKSITRSRRKGRRRTVMASASNMPLSPPLSPSKAEPRLWPCTSCPKTAKNLWEWKRHEATHVTGAWICMPENTPIVDRSCGICGLHDPQLSHFDTHYDLDACTSQPLADRSFARKDNLNDHIQRIHVRHHSQPLEEGYTAPASSLLGRWRRDPSNHEALWCGFCKISCSDWQERLKHVGDHLHKGADIAFWTSFHDSE